MVKKKSLAWLNCSELELAGKVSDWLKTTDLSNSLIFLEGEMGAGKSTLVRDLLRVVAPDSHSMGSPTFSLVQTYQTSKGSPFYHIDLYRLKTERELADSGIETQIEEENALACVEWASLFPEAFAHWFEPDALTRKKKVFLINIEIGEGETRNYAIEEF